MWLMKTLLTSRCINQRGAGQDDWNQYSFQECAEKMIWGDIVDYHFVCRHCGTKFVLGAETYHGSGGYWSPENEKPSEIID